MQTRRRTMTMTTTTASHWGAADFPKWLYYCASRARRRQGVCKEEWISRKENKQSLRASFRMPYINSFKKALFSNLYIILLDHCHPFWHPLCVYLSCTAIIPYNYNNTLPWAIRTAGILILILWPVADGSRPPRRITEYYYYLCCAN